MEESQSSFARPVQAAAGRPTESMLSRGANLQTRAAETRRSRGRPKGSKNKVRALMTNEFLLKLKGELTPNDYSYLENVVKNGARIDVLREVQIMFAVLGRNLLPMMLEEMQEKDGVEEESAKYFRKDVTERLKVWQGLANVIHQIEKGNDDESDTRAKPILQVFERSGLDLGRFNILIGLESGNVVRGVDATGRTAVEVGAVPDQLPERQIDLPDSEQVEAVGLLTDGLDRDSTRSLHETQLSG